MFSPGEYYTIYAHVSAQLFLLYYTYIIQDNFLLGLLYMHIYICIYEKRKSYIE